MLPPEVTNWPLSFVVFVLGAWLIWRSWRSARSERKLSERKLSSLFYEQQRTKV